MYAPPLRCERYRTPTAAPIPAAAWCGADIAFRLRLLIEGVTSNSGKSALSKRLK